MDPTEFAALYDEHVDFVHRVALRLGIPAANAEDVVQDVFITAYKRHHSFEGRSSYRTWIYGITLFVVRRARRDAKRAGLHGLVIHDTDAGEAVTGAPRHQPDVSLDTANRWKTLMRLLDGLDEERREIFVLVELEQVAVTEAADILEIPVNTAYSRLRLARAAFQEALANERSDAPRETRRGERTSP